MEENRQKNNRGSVEVEATFILPIAILCVALLLYLSLFMFQKACLQACLETSLIYYKNTVTDTFVLRNDEMIYELTEDESIGKGNSYSTESPLDPYFRMFNKSSELNSDEDFETYFNSVAGNMIFNDDIEVKIEYKNYILLKQFEVTATQVLKFPIDFSLIGVDDEYEISASARVAVTDHDDTIRNIDYIVDLIEGTKIDDVISGFKENIGNGYNKMKDVLGSK